MEIKDLVKSRRTIHQFKPEPVPDDAIIRAAIEQAIWAPNHYLTQPWRFYLLGDKSKNQICLLNAELVHEKQGERAAEIKFKRWRDVPGWLVLTCLKSDNEVTMRENYASCCCVAQNLMLILWESRYRHEMDHRRRDQDSIFLRHHRGESRSDRGSGRPVLVRFSG